MEQPKSTRLRNLIATDKNIPNREETEMAKSINDMKNAKKKKEEEAAAKKAQEAITENENKENAPVAEEGNPENTGAENQQQEQQEQQQEQQEQQEKTEKTMEEKQAEMDALLAQAQQNTSENTGDKTDLFNTNTNGSNNNATGDNKGDEDLSEEEALKKAEKERKAQERERETQQYNAILDKANASLESQISTKEFTPKQKEFQKACSAFYMADVLLVETAPVPEISIGKRYKSTNDGPKLQKGVTKADYQRYKEGINTDLKKENLVEYDTVIKYNYKRPGKLVGGIVTLPTALAITVDAFSTENFEIPTAETLRNTKDYITRVVSFDLLYTYALLFCGGKIKEHPSLKEGNFEGAKLSGKLKADIIIAQTKQNGVPVTSEKRTFKAMNRSSLFVQENILPIKTFELTQLGHLDSETTNAMLANIKKALDKKEGLNAAPVTYLNELAESLIDYELNEEGYISNLTVKFVTGKVALGTGTTKDLALRHWSNSTRNAKNKKEFALVSDMPVVKYSEHAKKDNPSEYTYKKVTRLLGENMTLDQLEALGYPAAKIAKDLGVTEDKINEVYIAYLASQKARRDEQARAGKGKTRIKRKDNTLSNEKASRMLIDQLQGLGTIDLGLDADSISDAIASAVYES